MTRLQQQLDTLAQGAPPRRRRALRSAGAAQEVSGPAHAGEESAAVRRGLERDRRHAQACEGARGVGAQEHDRGGGAAEAARRAQRRPRRRCRRATTARTRSGSIPSATCARKRISCAPRPTQIEIDASRAAEERVPEDLPTAAADRRRRASPTTPAPPAARACVRRSRSSSSAASSCTAKAATASSTWSDPHPEDHGLHRRRGPRQSRAGRLRRLHDHRQRRDHRDRGYLGTPTNNVAEYAGLLDALEVAHEEGREGSRDHLRLRAPREADARHLPRQASQPHPDVPEGQEHGCGTSRASRSATRCAPATRTRTAWPTSPSTARTGGSSSESVSRADEIRAERRRAGSAHRRGLRARRTRARRRARSSR